GGEKAGRGQHGGRATAEKRMVGGDGRGAEPGAEHPPATADNDRREHHERHREVELGRLDISEQLGEARASHACNASAECERHELQQRRINPEGNCRGFVLPYARPGTPYSRAAKPAYATARHTCHPEGEHRATERTA